MRVKRVSHIGSAALLTLLVLLCLLPFLNKAFHIDDPLFLWSAQWIQSHPLDFYGRAVNWNGTLAPMAVVNNNPPLTAYYIAGAAALVGWKEVGLHLAFLVPALATVLGTFALARQFCSRPVLAAAATFLTPAMLVSSSTLMCDVMMVAFWVWALVFWCRGIQTQRWPALILAGLFAGFCLLTKFTGVFLIPLLLLYGWMKQRRAGKWLLSLLIPIAVLAGYEWYTFETYGEGLFQTASNFSASARPLLGRQGMDKLIVGLAFSGGSLCSMLFFAPMLWRKRIWIASLVLFGALVLLLAWRKTLGQFAFETGGTLHWPLLLQTAICAVAGTQLLLLAWADWYRRRDADALLLVAWLGGVFLFAAIINWTVNGRSLLALVPAAGILVARRLETNYAPPAASVRTAIALGLGGLVSLWATWADYDWANSARSAALHLSNKYKPSHTNLWFDGHWGFQFYMERKGARPLDVQSSTIAVDDIIITPSKNACLNPLPMISVKLIETAEFQPNRWISAEAFYSSIFGVIPFAAGATKPDQYFVARAIRPIHLTGVESTASSGQELDDKAVQELAAQYRQRLAANPQDPQAHLELGAFLMDHGRAAEAEPLILKAAALSPAFAKAHARLGLLKDMRRETRQAIVHYREALRHNPTLVEALNNLAWILATDPNPALRDGAEAVRLARRACSLTAYRQAMFVGTLAAAYAEAGQFDQAIATGEKAAKLATEVGQHALAERNRELVEHYRRGQPYRQPQAQ